MVIRSSFVPTQRIVVSIALAVAVVALAWSVLTGLDSLSPGPDVHVEDQTILALEALVLAHVAVVGFVIWGLARILSGRREVWWRIACAYGLGAALTYGVWLLWVREFSGG